MIFRILCTLILLIGFFKPIFSQENTSAKVTLNWDSLYLEPIKVDSNFINSDAVILYKTMDITIPEISWSGEQKSDNLIYITVFERVKILKDKAVADFTHLKLPESYDPFFNPQIKNSPPHLNSNSSISDLYYRIVDMDARIIKDGKRIYRPELRVNKIVDSLKYCDTEVPVIFTHHNFSPVFAGDEVQIYYKIGIYPDIKYHRFFLPSKYPIQSYHVKIKENHHNSRHSEFYFHNSFKDKVVIKDIEKGSNHKSTYEFKLENLHGVDLQNEFSFVKGFPFFAIKYRSFAIVQAKINGSETKDVNLTSGIYKGNKQVKKNKADKEYFETKHNETNDAFYSYFLKLKKDTSIKNDFERMVKMHEEINTFSVYEANPNYDKLDPFPPNRAGLLLKKTFRARYSDEIYQDLLSRNDSAFYKILLMDRRYCDYNFNDSSGFQPFYNSYGFKIGKSNYYMYPPTPFASYHLNEIPFYLENSAAVFVPHNIDTIATKDIYKVNIAIRKSPQSYIEDNYRQIAGVLTYNEKENAFIFQGKEALSGHFSTILRNYYRTKLKDPVINKKYYEPLFKDEINALMSTELINTSTEYPYKSSYKKSGKIKLDLKEIQNNRNHQIDMKHLFSSILPSTEFLTSLENYYEFYPEFVFSDKYRIQIVFPFEVSEANLSQFNKAFDSENTSYMFNFSKIDGKTYLFDLRYEVKAHHFSPEAIEELVNIASEMEKLNSLSLQFTKDN